MVPEHDGKLFDFKIDKYVESRFRRELNRYDVVAITSMTPQIEHSLEVAQMAKDQGCTTIIGGYHPTLDPEYVAKHSGVDYAVRGEGEHTFRELIDFLDGNKKNINKKEIDGISYKNEMDGHLIHNKDRHLEPNLDNFLMPRRDLLKWKKYLYLGTRVAALESSRGCPHNCKFCCIIQMWKDPSQHITYRSKSVKRIMQEIYDVNWGHDFVFFCEDNFTINIKRTNKILDTIIRAGLPNKLYFSAQSRVDTLYRNPELIDKLDKASFRQIFLGIESVHQQSLDAMNKKNTTPDMIRKVVRMLQDRGISIFGGVIIGYPGETAEMVRETIQFAKSLEMTCVQFTPITAFPGTPFYEEMEKKKMITSRNYKNYDLFHAMMRTEQLSANEMYKLVAEAYATYYFGRDWLKSVGKRYCNPFSKFNWMLPSVPRFIKEVILNGYQMLYSMGVTSNDDSEGSKKDNKDKNSAKELPVSRHELVVPVVKKR